jgi:GNAT superfamily N-acetyltransferase
LAADIHIRRARPEDAASIHGFIRALAEYEKIEGEMDAREADTASALFGPQPRVFCEVAEHDGRIAGIAVWFYNYSTIRGRHGIYLEDLFVDPNKRGLGIGRALLSALAARCVAERLPRLDWSVLAWNTDAIGFYETLGADVDIEWRRCRLSGEALAAIGRPA